MAIERRGFLKSLTLGLVGGYMATSLPTGWLPTRIKQETALRFLSMSWNLHTKGTGGASRPLEMFASRRVFESFEGEIQANQRFVPHDTFEMTGAQVKRLAFKSAKLMNEETRGWYVRIKSADGREVTYS